MIKYIVAILSFRQLETDQFLFIGILFLVTMVPQELTNWKAQHVPHLASAAHPFHFLARIFLPFFLPPSHWGVTLFLFSLPDSMCSFSFSVLPLPALSFKSFFDSLRLPFLSPPLHSVVNHWLHSHVLLHTFTNPGRQAISGYFTAEQHTNSVTLTDVGIQADVNESAQTCTHTPTRKNNHIRILNLPQLYHIEMFCVPFANKPSSNKSKGWDLLEARNSTIHI